jgi:DNA-directed RNA polymerase subunit omega
MFFFDFFGEETYGLLAVGGKVIRVALGEEGQEIDQAAIGNMEVGERYTSLLREMRLRLTNSPRTLAKMKIIPMRDDYLQNALKVIDDPTILVNVVSCRVKQLKRGNRPLVASLERLSPEDMALREIAEGRITYELASPEELARANRRSYLPVRNSAPNVPSLVLQAK